MLNKHILNQIQIYVKWIHILDFIKQKVHYSQIVNLVLSNINNNMNKNAHFHQQFVENQEFWLKNQVKISHKDNNFTDKNSKVS